MKYPKVYFSVNALRNITAEVSRWYQKGIEKRGKPFEAVGFPLSYVKLQQDLVKSPVEIVETRDIDSLIVTHIAIPHDRVKNYSEGRANFRKRGVDIEEYGQIFFEKRIQPIIRKYPLLEIVSRLHSHPLSGGIFHSIGDKFTFQRDEIAAYSKGMGVSFSFIMTPKKTTREELKWDLICFLINGEKKEKKLEIEIVGNNHPLISEAKQPPYHLRDNGRLFEAEIKAIGNRFLAFREENFSRGWKSFWFKNLEGEIIFLLPPFFPEKKPKIYISETGKNFKEVYIAKSQYNFCGPNFEVPIEYIFKVFFEGVIE